MQDIQERRVRLVVLCGNAGDGKTALLQHLAERLNLGHHYSSERILEGQGADGPWVRINLDGSAAWQGRSADELLDEFLQPFLSGPPDEDIFHLLAINDGRLLEWIEGAERAQGEKPLFSTLYNMLNRYGRKSSYRSENSYVRFVGLNERLLVGGIVPNPIAPNEKTVDTEFLHRLTDQLYGGEEAADLWILVFAVPPRIAARSSGRHVFLVQIICPVASKRRFGIRRRRRLRHCKLSTCAG